MKRTWIGIIGLIVVGGGYTAWTLTRPKPETVTFREAPVKRGTIRVTVQTSGVLQPQNRVEIIPSVAGRIEEMLAKEGDRVKKGQILAWMSSSDRATLLDAALAKGPEEVKRWEDVYKPLPLVAPLDGTIIARKMEPGQRVVAAVAVFVMSNELLVKAQVDETDISKIQPDQQAWITLDAYPDVKEGARVGAIAHEAKTVNNVTVYEVDVLPRRPSPVFRAGMTANVTIIVDERKDVLTIPASAVTRENGKASVKLSSGEMKMVTTGMTDNKQMEITSGLKEGQVVLVPDVGTAWMQTKEAPTSPFSMGRRPRTATRSQGSGGQRR